MLLFLAAGLGPPSAALSRALAFFFSFTCLSKEKYIYWQIFSQNVAHREISQLIQSVTGDFPHPFLNSMGAKVVVMNATAAQRD